MLRGVCREIMKVREDKGANRRAEGEVMGGRVKGG